MCVSTFSFIVLLSSQNSPYHYAHFPSYDALPLTVCYRPNYTIYTQRLLSPFLARIAKGSPLICVESHLAVSQWQEDAFELGCL